MAKFKRGRYVKGAYEVYPLSSIQQGLLYHSLNNKNSGLYNTQVIIDLPESIAVEHLKLAWQMVVDRYAVMRAFVSDDSQLKIMPQITLALDLIDVRSEAELDAIIQRDRYNDIALNVAPLFRLKLLRRSEAHYQLIFNFHHIILAGDAAVMVIAEAFEIYESIITSKNYIFKPITPYFNYIDFFSKGYDKVATQMYWRHQLKSYQKNQISLPKPNNPNKPNQHELMLALNHEQSALVERFAKGENVTLNTVIMAAWAVILHRYCPEKVITFGMVKALPFSVSKNLAAMIINTLPIIIDFDQKTTVINLLHDIREQQRKIKEYVACPLAHVIKSAGFLANTSLFDTVVDYKPMSPHEYCQSEYDYWSERTFKFTTNTHYEITLEAFHESGSLHLRFSYLTSRYSDEQINQIAQHYLQTLTNMISNVQEKVDSENIFTPGYTLERPYHQIAGKHTSMLDVMERISQRYQDKIAIKDKHTQLTYRDLILKAKAIAQTIKTNQQYICILMQRNCDVVVAMLACWFRGAAYIPIDAEYPIERLSQIIQETNTQCILSQKQLADKIHELKSKDRKQVIFVDEWVGSEETNTRIQLHGNDTAYMIYTSGTTGKPKGVPISHRSLMNLVFWHIQAYEVDKSSVASQIATLTFDAATWTIWSYLSAGATLIICDDETKKDPYALISWCVKNNITHSFMPTPLAEICCQLDWPKNASLKYLLTGGDRLHPIKFSQVPFDLYNHYGPTEYTVVTTAGQYPGDGTLPNIGKPISNTYVYVLDIFNNPCPIGTIGELYIGGIGIADGYYNEAQLTKERFITNPYMPKEMIYRTGDRVRLNHDGTLEYIDRQDNQVQLHGYRIEINDIEMILQQYPKITQCEVIVEEKQNGNSGLLAYISVKSADFDINKLKHHLNKWLPDYMVPKRIIIIDEMPLTHNGKVNRQQLKNNGQSLFGDTKRVIASNGQEETDARKIWSKVFFIDQQSLSDDCGYYDLGGDSITAINISINCREHGYAIKPSDVFSCETFAEFVTLLSNNKIIDNDDIQYNDTPSKVPVSTIIKWHLLFNKHQSHFYQSATISLPKHIRTDHVIDKVKRALEVLINYRYHHDEYAFITNTSTCLPASVRLVQEGEYMSLKISLHHYYCDYVSWIILINDLRQSFEGNKTIIKNSFLTELNKVQASSSEQTCLFSRKKILNYQDHIKQALKLNDKPFALTTNYYRDTEVIANYVPIDKVKLSLAERNYSTTTDVLLLLALAKSVGFLPIAYEYHGRNKLSDDHVLGWLTKIIPIAISANDDMSTQLCEVINALHHAKQFADDYNALNYNLCKDYLLDGSTPYPLIAINYLGDQQTQLPGRTDWNIEKIDIEYDDVACMGHLLEFVIAKSDDRINYHIRYNKQHHQRRAIEGMVSEFINNINRVIDFAATTSNQRFSSSEFPLLNESQQQLSNIIASIRQYHDQQLPIRNLIDDIYPASALQVGLYYHFNLHQDSETYFVQSILDLDSALDPRILNDAIDALTQTYDILRTGFVAHENGLSQYVLSNISLPFCYDDISHKANIEKHRFVDAVLTHNRQMLFNLHKPPLMRFQLIKLEEKKYKLIINYHHILMGGWSFMLMVKQLFTYYCQIRDSNLKLNPSTPYKQYIEWLSRQDNQAAKSYWKSVLDDYDQCLKLDIQRAAEKKYNYKQTGYKEFMCQLSAAQTKSLKAIALNYKVTLNTVIQTLWGLLLGCYSGKSDIVYGVTSASRPEEIPGINQMVGLILSTLPSRLKLDADSTFIDLFKEQQKQSLKSRQFEFSALRDIAKCSQIKPGSALFDINYVYENYPDNLSDIVFPKISSLQILEHNNYKLTLLVKDGDNISLCFAYDYAWFSAASIKNLADHFKILIKNCVIDPTQKIHSNLLLTKHEIKHYTSPPTLAVDVMSQRSIIECFDATAQEYASSPAIHDDEHLFCYQDIYLLSNFIAYTLKSFQGSKAPVAILLDRSAYYPVCMYGILRLGCSYMPLNTTHPVERISYMLTQARTEVMITSHCFDDVIPSFAKSVAILYIEDIIEQFEFSDDNIHIQEDKQHDSAYVIFTSGSTGQPKGVEVQQKALLNLVESLADLLKLSAADKYLAHAEFSFDISGLEVHLPLLTGGSVYICKDDVKYEPRRIIDIINQNQLNYLIATPVTFQLLVDQQWQHEHHITLLSMGDTLSVKLAKALLSPHRTVWNTYGPTETTIISTAHKVTRYDLQREHIPIGKPLANQSVYLYNQIGSAVPNGVQGEIYFAGYGLAKGYINDSHRTNKAFVTKVFTGESVRLYRSGDIAYYNQYGDLVFISRVDNQIKHHGYRIELAEIENNLLNVPGVEAAIVLHDDNQLKAYIQSKSTIAELDEASILQSAATFLPRYMLPNQIIFIDAIPYTKNNKVDRKQLLNLTCHMATPNVDAILNPCESELANIWSQVLQHNTRVITPTSDFFVLGGDSLTGIAMLNQVNIHFSIQLSMYELMTHTTLSQLAQLIADKQLLTSKYYCDANTKQSLSFTDIFQQSVIRLQSGRSNQNLFLIHPIGGTVFCYIPLVNRLGYDGSVYAIQDPGIATHSTMFSNFSEMAEFYVKLIQAKQPQGPYYLCGASFGSNMSVEVARCLQAKGEATAFVGLIDGWAFYPAKATRDKLWFESNLMRQHAMLKATLPDDVDLPQLLLDLQWQRQKIQSEHRLTPIDFTITLFKSSIVSPVLTTIVADDNHWGDYCQKAINLHTVPGDHETVLFEPNVKVLAELLDLYLLKKE